MIGMIQPLLDGLSPLRLFSFGTNSKYTSIDVNNRLNFVALKLKAFGIEVAAYSADGDSREMKVMRNRIRLGASIPPSPQASSDVHSSHPSHSTEHPTGLSISDPHSLRRSFPFFVCDFLPSCIIFFQDVTHLGAKLRTRLNNTQKSIPLGNFIATTAHIVALQEIIGKDRHGLRVGDVLLEDKMNYDAVRRLSKPHVRELLSQYVPKSEGTCFYLELMDNSTSSYLDKKLSPLDRVYRMWKSVFELRYWRYWMSCDNVYPLGNHFITLNAYLCVEINAHALVMLITKLRDTPQLFKPWLFSSQPCESYFKACRSFTPVGSTQLNFTLLDFIYSRCKKVDVALRLTALGHSDNIVYPRHVKNLERYGGSEESFVCNILPSTDEIRVTMDRARIDAKAALMKLGVDVADPDDRVFAFDSRLAAKLNEPLENPAPKEDDVNEFDECEELEDEGNDPLDRNVLDEYEQSLLNVISEGQLNDYSSLLEKCVLRNENSPRPHNDPENVIHNSAFVVVTRSNGSQVAFKKRTVVWMCENGVKKQSNDRSKRVTQGHNFLLAKKLIVRVVEKRKIRIGDWCLFACENNSKKKKSRVMVGHVLSLSLINVSKKDSTKPIYDWKEGDKNVGVICDWFILDNKKQRISGLLIEQAMFSHGLHPCEYYVCSVPSPTFSVSQNKSEVRLSNETVVSLQESIKSYSV
ncbi:uncharacterized protein LOC123466338 [Daphnia magna]|uniref:uncharacterized protein LOC123466338 n=1 Tax=Daphnia magna TaxID=35525 RepID=UPI001E1BA359|nr:uncharacterized protein LOC123466338 [Daphnia magna]